MYGPHIEKQFAHIEFENEQLRRKVATQRLIEAEYQIQKRPCRSLIDIFGRFVPRLDLRAPAGRSPVAPN